MLKVAAPVFKTPSRLSTRFGADPPVPIHGGLPATLFQLLESGESHHLVSADTIDHLTPLLNLMDIAGPIGSVFKFGFTVFNFRRISSRMKKQDAVMANRFKRLEVQNAKGFTALAKGLQYLDAAAEDRHGEILSQFSAQQDALRELRQSVHESNRLAEDRHGEILSQFSAQQDALRELHQLVHESNRLIINDLGVLNGHMLALRDASFNGACRHIEEAMEHLRNLALLPNAQAKIQTKALFHQALGHATHKLADGIDGFSTSDKRIKAMLYYGICCAYQGLPEQSTQYIDRALSETLKQEITPAIYRQLAFKYRDTKGAENTGLIFAELAVYKSERLNRLSGTEDLTRSRFVLADTLAQLGLTEEAEATFHKLLQSHKPSLPIILAHFSLGNLYTTEQHHPQARQQYQKALSLAKALYGLKHPIVVSLQKQIEQSTAENC